MFNKVKLVIYIVLCLFIYQLSINAQTLEDVVISTNGKLTDIMIEDNSIIDVYPLITVMNDRNTIVVHPLKTGSTRFCLSKNNKEKVLFNVSVSEFETKIDDVENFDIFSLDIPPEVLDYELDLPPNCLGNKGD